MDVYLAVFDKASFVLSEKLLGEVSSYIDEHYVEEHLKRRRELLDVERSALDEAKLISYNVPSTDSKIACHRASCGLDDLAGNLTSPSPPPFCG